MLPQRDTVSAILLFLYVLLSSAIIIGIVRHISAGMHTFQIVLFYNLFALLFFLPLLWRRGMQHLKPRNTRLLWLRAVLEFGSFSLSFYALTQIPLPSHTALLFVAPIFGTIIAMVLLGERPTPVNLACIATGFIGVLFITRPGFTEFNLGVLCALGAAMGFALCGNTIKLLTRSETPQRIALYMLVMSSAIALPFGLAHWHTPAGFEWLWLAVIGALALSQQLAVAAALSKVPYTTVIPLNFAQLVFVSVIAYFAFGEIVDSWTVGGATVIIAATLFNAYHTARRSTPGLPLEAEKA